MMLAPARKPPDTTRYSGRFAERLRSLREKTGLLQEDIAKTLGVTPTTVYRWESGKNQPEPDLLPELAEALGITNVQLLFPRK